MTRKAVNSVAVQVVTAVTLFLVLRPAAAGPFGLEKGMTLQQLGGNPQQVAPGKYKITTVPKPHSAFEAYVLEIGPHSGLCWIKAIGKNVSTSVYGVELHTAFDSLKGKLDEAYGTPRLMDTLLPNSIWNEPNEWMMGLLKKERRLFALWDRQSHANLPPDITAIDLYATALATGSGYIAVEYSFTNEGECDAELTKADDSAL